MAKCSLLQPGLSAFFHTPNYLYPALLFFQGHFLGLSGAEGIEPGCAPHGAEGLQWDSAGGEGAKDRDSKHEVSCAKRR